MAKRKPIKYGFFTPAEVSGIFGGKPYEYKNNSLEARANLWDYHTMHDHIEDVEEKRSKK